jgi:predicted metal-binding protein
LRFGVIYNNDINKAVLFVDLWNETLDELKSEDKNLVLHHIKFEIERRMEDRVEDLASFEKTRFDMGARYNYVALEGNCKICKNCYSLGVELQNYLKIANLLPSEPITGDCVLCNAYD